ncbi:MAG: cupin domain-containing protein [Kiritimatiellia bacterium]
MSQIQIEPAEAVNLAGAMDYSEGAIVSKTLIESKSGTLTLFAFDAGQGLSEHISPYNATVYILEGEATLIIGDKTVRAGTGEMVVMPANVPHAVQANSPFKMLLILIR